jgi:transposase
MGELTTIGLDLAKHVFQVHGVDAEGATVLRKQLRRAQVLAFFSRLPSCLVGLEACATAHYWARELGALGHVARVMRPRFADSIRATSPSGLREQAGHMTASDFCAAREFISCQAGAIHT